MSAVTAPRSSDQSAPPPDLPSRSRSVDVRQAAISAVERLGLPLFVVLAIVVFGILRPHTFLTVQNLQSILTTQSVLTLIAVGAVVPFTCGQFDLSLPAVASFASLTSAWTMTAHGWPLWQATVTALLIGALAGLVNGLVVTYLGVNSIITTLGVSSVLQGLTLWLTDGATVQTGLSPSLLNFGSGLWLGVPKMAYVVALAAVAVGYLTRQTPLGRSMIAIGVNDRAAHLVGLRVRRATILAFVCGGVVAGGAGLLQVAAVGSASPSFGPNLLLPTLAAVFLGATTIRPGQYNVTGTILAVAFLAVSLSGLALVGAPAFVEPIYDGGALVMAVAASTLVRRRRSA